MTLTVTIISLINIAYVVLYYAALLYAILYGLGKFGFIDEKNGFYNAITTTLQKFLSPLLKTVRCTFKYTAEYDFSPFILFIILHILPMIISGLMLLFGFAKATNALDLAMLQLLG